MKKLALAALALSFTAPFWDLGHPLWEVDDARYAEVPRELHEAGWPLIPTLNGMDYVEKPPLIYWLGAASYGLFGVSEAAARLPLALAALVGLAGVWWLGGWLFSPATGRAAALVLGSMGVYAGLSHMITPDMTLTAALVWATALGLRVLHRPEDSRWAAPAAWLAIAAAFLSKGLIALLLPALWTTALAVLYPNLRQGYKRLLLGPGPVLFLAIVGTWVYAMERAAPGFCRVFFLEQHFQRFLDVGKYNRPGGWWYFLAEAAWGSLPWTPAALCAIVLPVVRWRKADASEVQLALWSLLVIAFFTTSSSKLPTYILPAFPFMALLTARFLVEGRADARLRAASALLAGILALAAIALPFVGPRFVPGLGAMEALLAAAAVASLAAAVFLAPRGPSGMPGAALAALTFIGFALVGARRAEPWVSSRPISWKVNEFLAKAEGEDPQTPVRLVAYDRYLQGVPFYTRRTMDVVNWVGELHYAKRFERFQDRFGDDKEIRAWPRPGERVLVVTTAKQAAWVERTRGGPGSIRGLESVGPYSLFELTPAAKVLKPLPPSSGGRAPARG